MHPSGGLQQQALAESPISGSAETSESVSVDEELETWRQLVAESQARISAEAAVQRLLLQRTDNMFTPDVCLTATADEHMQQSQKRHVSFVLPSPPNASGDEQLKRLQTVVMTRLWSQWVIPSLESQQ